MARVKKQAHPYTPTENVRLALLPCENSVLVDQFTIRTAWMEATHEISLERLLFLTEYSAKTLHQSLSRLQRNGDITVRGSRIIANHPFASEFAASQILTQEVNARRCLPERLREALITCQERRIENGFCTSQDVVDMFEDDPTLDEYEVLALAKRFDFIHQEPPPPTILEREDQRFSEVSDEILRFLGANNTAVTVQDIRLHVSNTLRLAVWRTNAILNRISVYAEQPDIPREHAAYTNRSNQTVALHEDHLYADTRKKLYQQEPNLFYAQATRAILQMLKDKTLSTIEINSELMEQIPVAKLARTQYALAELRKAALVQHVGNRKRRYLWALTEQGRIASLHPDVNHWPQGRSAK